MAVDPNAAREWVRSEPANWSKLQLGFVRFRHHRWPRFINKLTTNLNLWFLVFKLLPLTGLATSPFWIEALLRGTMQYKTAIGFSAVLLTLMLTSHLYDSFRNFGSEGEKRIKHADYLAVRHRELVDRFAEGFSLGASRKADQLRRELVKKVLECVEHLVRGEIGEFDANYFQASLLTFDDRKCNRLLIRARSREHRSVGQRVPAKETMAYFLALEGAIKRLPDIRRQSVFPMRGLSEASVPYRSILFLPIIQVEEGKRVCPGIVTIDSARPCEFWGPAARSLEDQVMPFIRYLDMLLVNHPYKLVVGA